MLQATHHEPAIRHAAIALGALHECTPDSDEEASIFALQQYGKAIGYLVELQGKNRRAADVVLMTCVLFVCFEVSLPNLASIIIC